MREGKKGVKTGTCIRDKTQHDARFICNDISEYASQLINVKYMHRLKVMRLVCVKFYTTSGTKQISVYKAELLV